MLPNPDPFPDDLFEGEIAVVTGAARGIGRAIAAHLLACGARVVSVDSDPVALDLLADRDRHATVVADVGETPVAELAADIGSAFGSCSIVVNNVGVSSHRSFLEVDEERLDRTWRANVRGPWSLTRELVRARMDARLGGSILFVSSLHDTFIRLTPDYSSTKSAISMLMREMAFELAPHRFRVNAIAPGAIDTSEPPASHGNADHLIPLGRAGLPNEVARLALVVLSDRFSSYMTGSTVRVDGGLALHNWLMDLYESAAHERRQWFGPDD